MVNKMKKKEWRDTIATSKCEFIEIVQGGAMCKEGNKRGYCCYSHCPKIEMER